MRITNLPLPPDYDTNPCYNYLPADLPIPVLYETEQQRDDAIVYVHLFAPGGMWSWFVLEWDKNDTLFGLVNGFELEYGYFSLTEIKEARTPLGLPIERDLYFNPTPLGLVKAKIEKGEL